MEDNSKLVYDEKTGMFEIVPLASFEDAEICIISEGFVAAVPTIDKMEEHIKWDEKPGSEDNNGNRK